MQKEVFEILVEKIRDWLTTMRPYTQLLGCGVEAIDDQFYFIMEAIAEFMGASKEDFEYCWECAYEQAKASYEDNGGDWFKSYL